VDGLMTFEEYAEVQEKAEIEYEEISESGKRVVYFGADHSNSSSVGWIYSLNDAIESSAVLRWKSRICRDM